MKKGTLSNAVRTMRRAVKFAGKDFSREILTNVHFAENGDIVATDSWRMYVEPHVWDGDELNIPLSMAQAIAKKSVKVESAVIESEAGRITAKLSDGTVLVDEEFGGAGKYPLYGKLFEGLNERTVAYVNPKQLLPIARAHVKSKSKAIRIDVRERDFTAQGAEGEVMPSVKFDKACDGDDIEVGISPTFLRDTLNAIGGDAVRIGITSHIKPITFSDLDQTFTVLVMPVRIDLNREVKPERKYEQAAKRIEQTTGEKVEVKVEKFTTGKKKEPAKAQEMPKTHPYKGKRFYIFGEVGEPVEYTTRGGAKFTFRIGHEYFYRANGEGVACMFLGYDTAKDRPCFAEVTDGGDFWYTWPGDKRTLEYMVNHTYGEPSYYIDKDEIERAAKEKAGADVKATVNDMGDGVTAIVIEPKKPEPKEESMTNKRIEELEATLAELKAELKARNDELEQVWKENESLKRSKPEPKAEAPKPEPKADAATVVSLETLLSEAREWCKSHPNTCANRKRGNKSPVRISGIGADDQALHKELTEMGYRFAKGPQVWMFDIYKAEHDGKTVIDGR